MHVLAISGSLRRGSYNTALLHTAAVETAPTSTFLFWDRLEMIPLFNEDARTQPVAVTRLKETIEQVDAVLFATPEYNGSVPGALKNALDWISRPFDDNPLRDMPVAVIGASTGLFGAIWAQAELRKILRTMGASVHDNGLAVANAQHAFDRHGLLRDRTQRAALASILDTLRIQTAPKAA